MKIEHDVNANRFVAPDADDAYLEYSETADGLDLRHTIVPPDEQGEGVGSALVRYALEHARSENLRIVPSCPFVRDWLQKNPGYQDRVAGS